MLGIPYTRFPQVDPGPRMAVVSRITGVVQGLDPADERTRLLVALAHVSFLLRGEFDSKTLKSAKQRLASLGEGLPVVEATKRAVTAAQAAAA